MKRFFKFRPFFLFSLFLFFFVTVIFVDAVNADSTPCSGPKEIKTEIKQCKFDIAYPVLSDPKMECKVREWINHDKEEFGDGPDLDPAMGQKNQLSISCDVSEWNGYENVVLHRYEYAQGAHGASSIKTFVFEKATGRELTPYGVIDRKKNWTLALLSFINKTEVPGFGTITANEWPGDPGKFETYIVDQGDLVLFFDQCSLVPCGYGIIKIRVPLKKIRHILKSPFNQL